MFIYCDISPVVTGSPSFSHPMIPSLRLTTLYPSLVNISAASIERLPLRQHTSIVESFDNSFSTIRRKSSDRTSIFNAPSICPPAYSCGVRTSSNCTESALISLSNSCAETETILSLPLQPDICVALIVISINNMNRLTILKSLFILLPFLLWNYRWPDRRTGAAAGQLCCAPYGFRCRAGWRGLYAWSGIPLISRRGLGVGWRSSAPGP